MPIPDEFLREFNINREKADATGLSWDELQEIKADFEKRKDTYEQVAESVSNTLRRVEGVHAISARVKDPDHLIAKIIRKRIGPPTKIIDKNNYRTKVTDLVGVRALHLFKADWEHIDLCIRDKWHLHEKPIANVRDGDDKTVYAKFAGYPRTVKEHDAGYRSIHYIVKTTPEKETITAEIQVRTIYEEAWGEIDHSTRYPNRIDDPILNAYLSILNKLSGAADEMGTFIQQLTIWFDEADRRYQESQEQIRVWKEQVANNTEISTKEKKLLEAKVDHLEKFIAQNPPPRAIRMKQAELARQTKLAKWSMGGTNAAILALETEKADLLRRLAGPPMDNTLWAKLMFPSIASEFDSPTQRPQGQIASSTQAETTEDSTPNPPGKNDSDVLDETKRPPIE